MGKKMYGSQWRQETVWFSQHSSKFLLRLNSNILKRRTTSCLVTDILKNIIFWVQQVWNIMRVIFRWTIPLGTTCMICVIVSNSFISIKINHIITFLNNTKHFALFCMGYVLVTGPHSRSAGIQNEDRSETQQCLIDQISAEVQHMVLSSTLNTHTL